MFRIILATILAAAIVHWIVDRRSRIAALACRLGPGLLRVVASVVGGHASQLLRCRRRQRLHCSGARLTLQQQQQRSGVRSTDIFGPLLVCNSTAAASGKTCCRIRDTDVTHHHHHRIAVTIGVGHCWPFDWSIRIQSSNPIISRQSETCRVSQIPPMTIDFSLKSCSVSVIEVRTTSSERPFHILTIIIPTRHTRTSAHTNSLKHLRYNSLLSHCARVRY